jgi:hypothetical protein
MGSTVPHMKAFCANPVIFPQSSILTISVVTFNNFMGMHCCLMLLLDVAY